MIIAHLDGTLDFEQGEVSERLHAIYGFCLKHLNSGTSHTRTPTKLEEVSELLGELREAWARSSPRRSRTRERAHARAL